MEYLIHGDNGEEFYTQNPTLIKKLLKYEFLIHLIFSLLLLFVGCLFFTVIAVLLHYIAAYIFGGFGIAALISCIILRIIAMRYMKRIFIEFKNSSEYSKQIKRREKSE